MSKQRWAAADAASMQSADGGSRTASTLGSTSAASAQQHRRHRRKWQHRYRLSRGGAGTAVPR
ncbi:hypothetical protein [Kribbella soli]|uniref:Uncharacterized protein n=1 Tax=Kribbella soli TaxID=1124743 RepID=A0A4R0H6E8_9ACTN|nr:hypothetical protein [Kribbella soli]TCC05308.1 hypothetical protein E0H45_25075 [Kribbella soli]